jgi:heat shock protein HslJ
MVSKKLNRVSTTFFIAVACLICTPSFSRAGGMPESEAVTGMTWQWHETLYNNDEKSIPPDPSHYTIAFNPDGTLNIRADCNRGGGAFSTNGKNIAIEVTHTTRAMCPPDSLEQPFIKDLNAAKIYFFKNDSLYLDLKYDTGTMKLGR